MASNRVTVSLDAKKLLEKLRKLPDETQDKVIKKAVRKGANIIRADARKNVPVDSGYMKKKIQIRQAKKRSLAGQFVMIVNVNSNAHHLIELGTKDREPTKHKFLSFETKDGKIIFVKKVKGIKANPFLGNAYDSNKDNVFKTFIAELDKIIKSLKI
ncbi:HK97 gp10 family phage protein [Algoriphagus sp. 4150]|uniref:HK97-gp10 family putative phage morphogenesis protein n=1 Tax=Algoriphagus sp. 4150 TaxID=2817756 RepID=UPI0028646CD6|nr:HK97-gp10 family putative phage morphogenesis protein [Algoriphagus sp. 4150]MDR7130690.1 HK97 gp10 family phage protein [Algoriphagus sp. 4150]